MNVIQILRDYNITHQVDGSKTTRGFVNIHCPFCVGSKNYHLGIELDGKVAHCWRCGTHSTRKVFETILRLPPTQIQSILRKYGGQSQVPEKRFKIRKKEHRLPTDTGPLEERHKRYLRQRNFDPEDVKGTWGILATGPMSLLDGVDYKHRILAPIYWDGKPVSFQARDITGKHPSKYMACPEERELIKHKSILYGRQEEWDDVGICVEGIPDVWRLGTKSFATFGIEYTNRQVREMARVFRRIIILFDEDAAAQAQAQKLRAALLFRGREAVIEQISGDPGSLDAKAAKQLVKKFFSLRLVERNK